MLHTGWGEAWRLGFEAAPQFNKPQPFRGGHSYLSGFRGTRCCKTSSQHRIHHSEIGYMSKAKAWGSILDGGAVSSCRIESCGVREEKQEIHDLSSSANIAIARDPVGYCVRIRHQPSNSCQLTAKQPSSKGSSPLYTRSIGIQGRLIFLLSLCVLCNDLQRHRGSKCLSSIAALKKVFFLRFCRRSEESEKIHVVLKQGPAKARDRS